MSIFGKIYKGPHIEELDIADIISIVETEPAKQATSVSDTDQEASEEILASISRRADWFYDRDGPQPPVTEQESAEITRQVELIKQELRQHEAYISGLQSAIEREITASAEGGLEVAISLDTKNKPALKKAIRKLFGVTKTNITLSDFKLLLEARAKMEQEAVVDYAKGFPE